mmetsp:Transcript_436/g.1453  ORF Transcript_436/g.1453 Transcript_436/m.1453 type:complete len:375 (-) Transcript_436:149-1273(-)
MRGRKVFVRASEDLSSVASSGTAGVPGSLEDAGPAAAVLYQDVLALPSEVDDDVQVVEGPRQPELLEKIQHVHQVVLQGMQVHGERPMEYLPGGLAPVAVDLTVENGGEYQSFESAGEGGGVSGQDHGSAAPRGQERGEAPSSGGGFFCDACDCRITSVSWEAHLSSTMHQFCSRPKNVRPPTSLALTRGNRGYQLLERMGWAEDQAGLGVERQGRVEPVRTQLRMDRRGIGTERPPTKVTHFPSHQPNPQRPELLGRAKLTQDALDRRPRGGASFHFDPDKIVPDTEPPPAPRSRRQKKRDAKQRRQAKEVQAKKQQQNLRVDFAQQIPDGYEAYFVCQSENKNTARLGGGDDRLVSRDSPPPVSKRQRRGTG